MSADNAIYIAEFRPTDGSDRYYLVAYGGCSQINELETHYYPPEERRNALNSIFGSSKHYDTLKAAQTDAFDMDREIGTEYGVQVIQFDHDINELGKAYEEPKLPDYACPHCSSTYSHVSHGGNGSWNDTICSNPDLAYNILIKGFREAWSGPVNEHIVSRTVLEILTKNGLKIVKDNG